MMGNGNDDRAEIFPAGTKLRLLRDRLLVRPLEWVPSRIIAAIRFGRPVRGVIEAVGPGRLYRRYRDKPAALRRSGLVREQREFRENGTLIRPDVRVGDIIELGGLNIFDGEGYNFPQVIIGTKRFLICQEQDVCFVHEWQEEPRREDARPSPDSNLEVVQRFHDSYPERLDA